MSVRTAWWWTDLEAYRDRLTRYSLEELEDIYYHMDIVHYPQYYRLVLLELERRALRPSVAERPLPGWHWSLPGWLARCSFLSRVRPLYLLSLAVCSSLLSFLLTLLGFLPLWLVAGPFGALNAVAALFYLALLPVPIYLGFAYAFRAGARGWLMVFALAGSVAALWWFTHLDFFHRLIAALSQPDVLGNFFGFPM